MCLTNQRRCGGLTLFALLTALLLSGTFAHAEIVGKGDESWDSLYEEGLHQFDIGHYKDAESLLRSARDLSAGDTLKYCATLEALFSTYTDQDNYPAAEAVLLDYLACIRAGKELAPSRESVVLSQLSTVNSAMKKYDRAEDFSRQAIALIERLYGADSPETASEMNNLGCAELRQNKLAAAEQHILKATGILEKTLGKDSTPYGLAALNMAEVYELQQNCQQSMVWYRRAMSSFDAALGARNPISVKIAERCKSLKANSAFSKPTAKPHRHPERTSTGVL